MSHVQFRIISVLGSMPRSITKCHLFSVLDGMGGFKGKGKEWGHRETSEEEREASKRMGASRNLCGEERMDDWETSRGALSGEVKRGTPCRVQGIRGGPCLQQFIDAAEMSTFARCVERKATSTLVSRHAALANEKAHNLMRA